MTATNEMQGTRTYVTEEVTFEVPLGFVDKSVHLLSSTKQASPISLTIDRNEAEGTLTAQVTQHVDNIKKVAPHTKVLGARDREVGNLPAREVKMSTIAGKQQIYVRQTNVHYYGTLLTFTVSSLRAQQQLCDAAAEQLLTGLKFRRR